MPGSYTLRAFRRGGGEGVAENVPTGTTRRLTILTSGSIEGVAKNMAGGISETTLVGVEDDASGFKRTESFYRTNGRFVLRDLPAGRFAITVSTSDGRKTTDVFLAQGETRSGIEILLAGFVTVTGRIVDAFSREPVANMQMSATGRWDSAATAEATATRRAGSRWPERHRAASTSRACMAPGTTE